MESSHFKLLEFTSRELLVDALAHKIVTALSLAIEQKGFATLLLSGGSTPKKLFAKLSNRALSWENVRVSLVDERCVSVQSEASNERLVRENLLINAAKSAQFYGLMELNSAFEDLFESPDVVVLGMGLDGHTASFFPEDSELGSALYGEEFFYKTTAPTEPRERITLSRRFLLQSQNLLLHIEGEEKKTVFIKATNAQTVEHYPIKAMMQQTTPLLEVYYAD